MLKKIFFLCLIISNLLLYKTNTAQRIPADTIITDCIWNEAAHNAFTDLEYFKKHLYCSFREGDGHLPQTDSIMGEICIIRSSKTKDWELVKRFTSDRYDLRDSKMSIMPDGRLMLLVSGIDWKGSVIRSQSTFVSFSNNGIHFSDLMPVVIDPSIGSKWDLIWSLTWTDSVGYAALLQRNKPNNTWNATLLKTYDGISYIKVNKWNVGEKPTEARIRFTPDGRLIAIVRLEPGLNGKMGVSSYPYTEWEWFDLKVRLGGPNFHVIDDTTLLIGSRIYDSNIPYKRPRKGTEFVGQKTGLCISDDKGNISKSLELISDGDCSYPGILLIKKNQLYVSYYSSHNEKASIYLLKTRIETLLNRMKD
jgi:hypothetical protein